MEEAVSKKDNYELFFHLNPELEGENLDKKLEQLKDEILSLEGLIIKFKDIRKIRLSYPINKNSISNFGAVEFTAPKEKISDLNNKLKMDDSFLRHLITRKEKERVLKPRKEYKARIKKEKPKEGTKAESKEIEKKLEEILEKL